jgi:uncharacterized protein (TIGR02001 family)
LALAALLAAARAPAQVNASMALASEYSARGVSLSDGRAAPQVSLGYDAAAGWYTGLFASRAALRERGGDAVLMAYGGYSARLASGLSWEAGASSTAFHRAAEYNYREVYAGLAGDLLSARLYLAPSYYGYAGRAAYAEINGFYPLYERLKLIGHIGTLRALGANARARDAADLRLGLGLDLDHYNFQLAWQTSTVDGGRVASQAAPRKLALSAAYSF